MAEYFVDDIGEPPTRSVQIKLITLGNTHVGKSCVIKRYCERAKTTSYQPTVGIDYGLTRVTVKGFAPLSCNIFDLSGNPHFYEVRMEFYRNTQIALLVFDITSRKTFEALDIWLREMKSGLGPGNDLSKTICAVCANKVDLVSSDQRGVPESESRLWAAQKGFHYFEVSAMNGVGIDDMFQVLFYATVEVLKGGSSRVTVATDRLTLSKEQREAITLLKNGTDDYQRLGLQPNAQREDVIHAFRRMAILLHPDKTEALGAEEGFKILSHAKENLLTILKK